MGGIKVSPEKARILVDIFISFLTKFKAEIMKKAEMKQKETFGWPDMLFKNTQEVEIRRTKPNWCIYSSNNFLDKMARPSIEIAMANKFEYFQESMGSFPITLKIE